MRMKDNRTLWTVRFIGGINNEYNEYVFRSDDITTSDDAICHVADIYNRGCDFENQYISVLKDGKLIWEA